MKKALLSIFMLGSLALAACQSAPENTASQQKVAQVSQNSEVRDVRIKPINSFLIEVAPSQVACNSVNGGQANCLQYRNSYQKAYNPLKTQIEGFNYKPGFAYILDVKQEVVQNEVAGKLETKWVLNRIVSRAEASYSN